MNNKKSSNKSIIKIILMIIIVLLVLFIIALFYESNRSKKLEEHIAQSQIEQEERRKQQELERQKEQEEKARQEQEKYEVLKASLPTKFDIRNKVKINVENQGQKPFCSFYAYIKSIEITLNYQDNYDYNFKKVYKYLKTAPNNLKETTDPSILIEELIGLDCTYKDWGFNLEDLTLIKNEIINGRPILIDINKELALKIGAEPSQSENGHRMIIIGYDDTKQSWLVLNSWSSSWRNNGTMWIRYDSKDITYQYNSMFQAVIKE